jgi:tagatose-6-phosphate ketose/aldose isomerase
MSNDRYTRQYDEDLLQEICSDGQAGHVIALTAQASERGAGDMIDLGLDHDEEEIPSDLELCLPYVAFAQLLALHRSLSLGLTPDNPNAAGTVSRVVRGVSIHPYPHSGLL